ncbi:hypothetical protein FQN54_009678 [Arachnomyces sp. PD_36]|nr:hypothetical protein FQN54_009678 [Arachnomyces sp. PD_36]
MATVQQAPGTDQDMGALHGIRNVAIIGAGPTGLAAAKYLLAEKCFDKIDIFEQRSTVGGVWNYSPASDKRQLSQEIPQVNPHQPPDNPIWHTGEKGARKADFVSPLYDNLETNIPNFLMRFSDKPFPENVQLFPKHETVIQYLEDYSADIRHLIQFQVQVTDTRLEDASRGTWSITTKTLETGQENTGVYDAVVVASGHYNVPNIPSIPGISAWNETYPGALCHSKFYNSPESYRDKKVVIVGNSASGVDLGIQIGSVCRKPLISSSRSESLFGPDPNPDKLELPEIVEFLSPENHDRAIRFSNGHIEEKIDAIVFCTGYFYSYPFLSSPNPPVVNDGNRNLCIYQHLFYIEHPTMVFPVLNNKVIPFPLAENQAAVFSRVWSGRLVLPSKQEMHGWEDSLVHARGPGKAFHALGFPMDADFINFLYDWSSQAAGDGHIGKLGVRWGEKERWARERFPLMKKAFASHGEARRFIRTLEELGFDYNAWKEEQETKSQEEPDKPN